MNMNSSLLQWFGATLGAVSKVTLREATGDKSVTLDQNEKSILHRIYPPDTFTRVGGAAADGKPSHLNFNVYNQNTNTFELRQIAIKYPKSSGNELRLYFNRESGFYPKEDCVWFIFLRHTDRYPCIGYMPTIDWNNLSHQIEYDDSYALDNDDEQYQKALHSPQARKGGAIVSSTKFYRSPSLAAEAIHRAHYNCEYDQNHYTFIASTSLKPYVEVHHLIPIAFTNHFQHSLDVYANLVVLCPNCHRAIHFGDSETKQEYLKKFYQERAYYLQQAGITVSLRDLFDMYKL